MAEDRRRGWVVLPCVESMAQANWFTGLRPAAELTLLPAALLSTLPLRAQSDRPDVIVIAGGEQSLGGSGELSTLRAVFADTPAVLLTEEPSAALLRRAERLHIHSVLPMEVTAQQLVAAIAATMAGLAVTLPGLPAGPAETTHHPDHLTAREVEVLRLMARGHRNKQVAALLNISEHTAKFHVSAVIAKLGARTRIEAVTIGVTRGLVAI